MSAKTSSVEKSVEEFKPATALTAVTIKEETVTDKKPTGEEPPPPLLPPSEIKVNTGSSKQLLDELSSVNVRKLTTEANLLPKEDKLADMFVPDDVVAPKKEEKPKINTQKGVYFIIQVYKFFCC